MGSPRLGGGSGLNPGVGRVHRGQDGLEGKKLPRGLIARVWREFARPYRGRLLLLLVAIAGASAFTVLPARAIGEIVDVIESPGPDALAILNLYVGLLVAIAIGAAVFSLWQRYLSAQVGEWLIADLRRSVFDHVQRLPMAFFTRTQTGALVSRLNNDVIGAQRALTGTFGTLAANVVQALVAIALMIRISPVLTALVLAVLPIFVLLARKVGEKLQQLTRRQMALNAEMNTQMTERLNVAGALLVKLFGRPATESAAFAEDADAVAEVGVRTAVVGRLFFVILTLLGALGTALVYWVGGRGVLEGTFTAGQVVEFGILVTQAYQPLAALSNAPVEVLTALVSFDRVFEVLDLKRPIDEKDDAVELGRDVPLEGEVRFDGVWFRYPSAADSSLASLERGFSEVLDAEPGPLVLRDVSFVAPAGSTVALVGPSGAGKTTVCHLVPRLYDVEQGSVSIDGLDVRDTTLGSLADAIGVVTQDAHLFHDSVAANLRYAREDATDEQLVEACRAARIHDVVAALPDGYDTIVGERGYRLSGGEKQRLAIARVLLKDPAIVVLDEATAHLDTESEAAVRRALDAALEGRTSLVIAHRLSTVVDADEILVLDGGEIVQRGTHDELLAAGGLYAQLYRTQLAGA
ncbi:ABC transporter ATP-binding protein [Egibacter rhizosphaerae]|nr:ABC transporter ATP-binding protein [Egibacter rhizosphaerae]